MGVSLHSPKRSFHFGYGQYMAFRVAVAEKYFEGHDDLIRLYKRGSQADPYEIASLMLEYGYAKVLTNDKKCWQNLKGSTEAGMDFMLFEADSEGEIPYIYADKIIPFIERIDDIVVGYIDDQRNIKTEFIAMLRECQEAKEDLYWD